MSSCIYKQAEQSAFSERLRSVLQATSMGINPSALHKAFNKCSPVSVTIYSVRKWMHAEAIPTQDKLITLARMLGVDANWLRYGQGLAPTPKNNARQVELNKLFEAMSPDHQSVLLATARALSEVS